MRPAHTTPLPSAPVGVFDSGIGGLSILRALHGQLPAESFVYYADSAHAPYGERDTGFVTERSLAIAQHLRARHGIKALVVACNTATSVAVQALRHAHPDMPVVGVEPAIKPAVAHTRTGHIGVLATRATVNSGKFQALLATLRDQATFSVTPCDGLAHAIEAQDDLKIEALLAQYISATGRFGSEKNCMDTLVLGCTHYPLEHDRFQRAVGAGVTLIEPGDAVARQLARVLDRQRLLLKSGGPPGRCHWDGSAPDKRPLTLSVVRWLPPSCQPTNDTRR